MANCPYHRENNHKDSQSTPAPQQAQHCQDCLTSHFISESSTTPDAPVSSTPALAFTVIEQFGVPHGTAPDFLLSFAPLIPSAHRVMRI